MSAPGGKDINVLVKALAAHVKCAAESGAGGATAPGDPPVQSAPVGAGAGKSTAESCKVCGRSSLHDGQRGAKVISEEDWYGLFEGDDLYADRTKIEREVKEFIAKVPEVTRQNHLEQGIPLTQLLTGPLRKRNDKNREMIAKFEARRDAVAQAKDSKCAFLPEPPNDIYRVLTRTQKKRNLAEWDLIRAELEDASELSVGASVIYRVPQSAGPCPASALNLIPETKLSKKCAELWTKLSASQQDAEDRWDSGGF